MAIAAGTRKDSLCMAPVSTELMIATPTGTVMTRLDSWKEIAAYLKRDVTTVRRWERLEGLPVHRHMHGKLGSVYAFTAEIDAWMLNRREAAQPPMTPSPPADPLPVDATTAIVATAVDVGGHSALHRARRPRDARQTGVARSARERIPVHDAPERSDRRRDRRRLTRRPADRVQRRPARRGRSSLRSVVSTSSPRARWPVPKARSFRSGRLTAVASASLPAESSRRSISTAAWSRRS